MSVEVFHWNPLKPVVPGRAGRYIPIRRRANNFGDMLAPLIVDRVLEHIKVRPSPDRQSVRLLSIGSILHFARSGDVVWGSGVNGKLMAGMKSIPPIDVRSVRGPLTREFLQRRGIDVPEVFGDPGLLLGVLWSRDDFRDDSVSSDYLVVPNLNDVHEYKDCENVMNPRDSLQACIRKIANSNFVTGSSLHAIVLADSLGIPARLISSKHEHALKYEDYYLGSGRSHYKAAQSVREAIDLGGEAIISWNPTQTLNAFPRDIWER